MCNRAYFFFLMCKVLYKLCYSVANYCPTCLLMLGFQIPDIRSRKKMQSATGHLLAIKAELVTPPILAFLLYHGLYMLLAQSLRNLITGAELRRFTLNKHGKLHCLCK